MMRQLRFEAPLVWTYNPLVGPIANALPRSLLIYHCVDDLTAAPHLPGATIEAAEAELSQTADLIFTTSPRLQERFASDRAAAYLEATRLAGFSASEARRFFGTPPKFSAAIARDYLLPWPAETAERRYLDRFGKLAPA